MKTKEDERESLPDQVQGNENIYENKFPEVVAKSKIEGTREA